MTDAAGTLPGTCPELLVPTRRTHPVRRSAAAVRSARRWLPVRAVLPGGDLRAPDAAALRSRLHAAARPGLDLVLDASQVHSVDAAVVGVLLGLDRQLRAHGAGLRLEDACPRLARALGVAGATGLLAG